MIKRILITSLITLFSLLIFGQEEPDTRNIGLVLTSRSNRFVTMGTIIANGMGEGKYTRLVG